jgi:hypothetical protein
MTVLSDQGMVGLSSDIPSTFVVGKPLLITGIRVPHHHFFVSFHLTVKLFGSLSEL